MRIEELRKELDAVDGEIVRLFVRRMELTAQVGEYKRSSGIPVTDSVRENEILSRVAAEAGEYGGSARELYGKIFELSRAQQRGIAGNGKTD